MEKGEIVKDVMLQQTKPYVTDPSLPSTAPKPQLPTDENLNEPKQTFMDNFYNKDTGKYCGRTCSSWVQMILYAIVYLMFLTTFTLVLLYVSLQIIKHVVVYNVSPLTYPEGGIGLTAIPTSEESYPLIWYKHGENEDFQRYVQAIDRLFLSNSKDKDLGILGPCGEYPYGYGESPCIIIKINRQFHWAGKPLQLNSTEISLAPPEVVKWIKEDQNKLWLQCNGYHSYDKEHIGNIKYYPDPPGFNPNLFPLDGENAKSPLIAIQISGFTIGISLAIECKLWYQHGPSTVEFLIYVSPDDIISFAGQTNINL